MNNNTSHYYGIMNDGSSSAKTMNGRELFLIKTAAAGVPRYSVFSLAEVADATAEGLNESLKSSFEKININIDRKDHEIVMCADGVVVNIKYPWIIKEEIGEHYQLILCPAHKIELAMHDAFKNEPLNQDAEKDYVCVYCFFRRANVKWRLFKRQSLFMKFDWVIYKWATGTRWVEHQVNSRGRSRNKIEGRYMCRPPTVKLAQKIGF